MARILVIDDDEAIRQLLRAWLERSGYEVAEAANGAEGCEAFRKEPADLVVTDIIMPEKEGLETMVELRNEYPDVKIIAISGGGIEDAEHYLEGARLVGGALRTFTKPLDRKEFIEAVKELLGE